MRTSSEIREIFEAKGLGVNIIDFGTSYRVGGAILIGESRFLSDNEPAVIKLADEKAFDGTGYDGRGRSYDIYIFRAPKDGEDGFVLVTEGKFHALPEGKRLQIGNETRSGSAYFFGVPEADNLGDLSGIFEELGL